MTDLLLRILAAYLLGGLMGGDVMRLLKGGGDLRQAGSGNVGATNALRTRGPAFALGVLAIDIGKGVFAALILPAVNLGLTRAAMPQLDVGFCCGVAVALGHCYPLLQKFKGGKGVATLAGVFGALLPWALPWMLGVFALAVILTGYVAIASIGGALTAYAWVLLHEGARSSAGLFALAMALLVVFKHRENILRLVRGGEHQFRKAMLLHKWLGRGQDAG